MEQESEEILRSRWRKKKDSIQNFYSNLSRLRRKLNKDLTNSDEKDFLTALCIIIMLKTSERVGNENSASDRGHFGVTGFKKDHIEIYDNGLILFEYKGKSGVEHFKLIQDKRLADYLSEAIINSPTNKVFVTSNGFQIKSDRINRYLSYFGIIAKDIRGFSANKMVNEKLQKIRPEKTEEKRKRQFNAIAKEVAEEVGHGNATLQKHYLVPEMKEMFLRSGRVLKLDRKYRL
jgi:DNA topoisomerase I